MDEKIQKKIARKIKHCEEVLYRHESIKTVKDPTKVIFVGNGGLGCNLRQETLMEIFSVYGPVENIVMIPDKPYSFVIFEDTENAKSALSSVNGVKQSSGHVLYLSFIAKNDVPKVNVDEKKLPNGLVVLENFLTEEEERNLLSIFKFEDAIDEKSVLKHRKVKHFGYEFIYGQNNVDKDAPLSEKIPGACISHLERLVALGHLSRMPDQLTVNQYLPGQGIPPHIDTHSAFEDGIVSISLGSQVVMEFGAPHKSTVEVVLPQRSALIMLGESRYLWKHGITPRKTDIVKNGNCLNLFHRSTRTSLTFRIVRRGECECGYPEQCDSQKKSDSNMNAIIVEESAEKVEKEYVAEVYDAIASHFSETRHTPWPRVAKFLSDVPPGSFLLDIGCGNGKNLHLTTGCYEVGCDASPNLLQICAKRGAASVVADCLRLPFRDASVDVAICIAVLHHLSTRARRLAGIKEILRTLRPKGLALIYVWAFEQETAEHGPSNYLKHPTCNTDLAPRDLQLANSNGVSLPLHENRTKFPSQDVLVPWKDKQSSSNSVKHRFYHVFMKGELEDLAQEAGAVVLESYYDKGNWCIIVENPS